MNAALFSWIEPAAGLVGWASVSAVVVILGVRLVRKVLGNTLDLRWRSALGWLVVVRLLCLVAPESRWSWRNLLGTGHWASVIGHWSLVISDWSPVDSGDGLLGQARGDSASSLSSTHQEPTSEPHALSLESEPSGDDLRGQRRGDSASSLSSTHEQPTHEHDAVRLEPERSGDGRRQPLTPLPDIVAARVPNPGIPWLGLFWFVGAILCFAMAVAGHLVFWRRVKCLSTPMPDGSEAERWLDESRQLLQVRRRVRLRTIEGLGSPVVFGFFRPTILLPVELARGLTAGEARHIFLHELAHIRCGDVPTNWLLIATRALHWFNPLVWIACRQIVADRELVRDAMALRALPGGDSARRAYGHTLLRLAATLSRPRLSPGLASLIHTEKEIQRRITMIKTPLEPNRRFWPLALAGSLALALVAVTFTTARGQDPAPAPSETEQGALPPQATVAVATDPTASPEALSLLAEATPVLAEVTPVLAEATTESASAFDIAVEPQVDQQSVRLNVLRGNEQRLAELDHEIAGMTAANKSQEVEILTSLRGELLKEIYRARYLPPANETAPSTSMKPMKKAAGTMQGMEKKKPAPAEPKQAAGAGMSTKDYLVRYPKGAATEVSALRAQIAAMAAQVEELKRQLDQHSSRNAAQSALQTEKANQFSEYKSTLDLLRKRRAEDVLDDPAHLYHQDAKTAALQAAHLADLARLLELEQRYAAEHPTLKAMKAKVEAEKREIEAAVKNLRNQIEAKPKREKSLPDRKASEAPPATEQAVPEPKPQPTKRKAEAPSDPSQASPGASTELPGPRKAVKRAGGGAVIKLDGKKIANEKESTPFLIQSGDVITVLEGWG